MKKVELAGSTWGDGPFVHHIKAVHVTTHGCITVEMLTNGNWREMLVSSLRLYIMGWTLFPECPHKIEKVGASAQCCFCRRWFGWWCPDSEDHRCEYSYPSEFCNYCGEPSERK